MRLRFTIRDLLWLAVVVALAVGWWIDRGRVARERDVLKHQLTGTPEQVNFVIQQLQAMENASQSAVK